MGTVADAVASTVQRGGLVIFPTDTVYGIGCDPARSGSVARIFASKRRALHKPLTLHIGSVEELLEYAPGNALAETLARTFLPGPLTIVVERPSYVGSFVTSGLGTIGLRVPRHALCQAILERTGPLAATSANVSGEPAFIGNGQQSSLPLADLQIDDGPTPLGVESTVIDVSGEYARLVREGAIGRTMLERIVGTIGRAQPGANEA
ncbi:MAG: threonylcarbamoyl-AMP synthase [Candidatus Eremiobacteraeota bacterium]|nr:threonylcarbamoyl-AMP synthase [Candidatus Eremiobacteraeota bacterium]